METLVVANHIRPRMIHPRGSSEGCLDGNAKGKQEHPDRLVKSENIVEEVVQCPQERFQLPHLPRHRSPLPLLVTSDADLSRGQVAGSGSARWQRIQFRLTTQTILQSPKEAERCRN
ncbi:hypothetical protein NQZ68_034917 [Dissostichus eleginoides]|nr:hypothetical protein NQZ68_034917 [Dissostichus eleginoides]